MQPKGSQRQASKRGQEDVQSNGNIDKPVGQMSIDPMKLYLLLMPGSEPSRIRESKQYASQ